eukprot:TRINITY_DN26902_c0_g1_i1.p1 TRINITY_DN26902_c0_g1~~TRINITY_DN26902_c0_g1_i1.p1  ORF type:complete len:100 (-),score=8.10 TRINITY_DN26902_c0_g1_i1:64-363(-)
MLRSLVGSEMCIRDSHHSVCQSVTHPLSTRGIQSATRALACAVSHPVRHPPLSQPLTLGLTLDPQSHWPWPHGTRVGELPLVLQSSPTLCDAPRFPTGF